MPVCRRGQELGARTTAAGSLPATDARVWKDQSLLPALGGGVGVARARDEGTRFPWEPPPLGSQAILIFRCSWKVI